MNLLQKVLILIVVEDGLVPFFDCLVRASPERLNPYCSGRWSRTMSQISVGRNDDVRLNPYCSGRWSRTNGYTEVPSRLKSSLNPYCSGRWSRTNYKNYG